MAEEIELAKCNFRNFTDAVTLTLTLNHVIRHTDTAYRRASLIALYVHTKFHWNREKKLFWTD